jgi:hypothetical protein
MFQDKNWTPKEGAASETRTAEWYAQYASQKKHDEESVPPRDLAFYLDFDLKVNSRESQSHGMPLQERLSRYGGRIEVAARPGAPALRDQPHAGRAIQQATEANRRLRLDREYSDRSRSNPRGGYTPPSRSTPSSTRDWQDASLPVVIDHTWQQDNSNNADSSQR